MIGWILAIGSLIGGQLIIKKLRIGFFIWCVVNISWVIFYIYNEIYSSAFLFSVFFIQALYGFIKWDEKEI